MGLNRRYRRESGAVAVEFALLIPVLALLALGIIDVGRLVFTYISVQDAAQEGALYAAYNPGDGGVTERVHESVEDDGAFVSSLSVDPGDCDLALGRTTVSVTGTVTPITPFMTTIIGGSIAVGRTITAPILVESCA